MQGCSAAHVTEQLGVLQVIRNIVNLSAVCAPAGGAPPAPAAATVRMEACPPG